MYLHHSDGQVCVLFLIFYSKLVSLSYVPIGTGYFTRYLSFYLGFVRYSTICGRGALSSEESLYSVLLSRVVWIVYIFFVFVKKYYLVLSIFIITALPKPLSYITFLKLFGNLNGGCKFSEEYITFSSTIVSIISLVSDNLL